MEECEYLILVSDFVVLELCIDLRGYQCIGSDVDRQLSIDPEGDWSVFGRRM